MDHDRFDRLTRSLGAAASRRGLGRALGGGSLAALVGWTLGGREIAAKKKGHKKKHKKNKKQMVLQPVFNQFGCADVGRPCRGDSSLCCSGVCAGTKPQKGKPDARVCAAHNEGNCSPQRNRCTSVNPATAVCNPTDEYAACLVTTGSAPFCGSLLGFDKAIHCQVCSKDADCLTLGFPPGSACVQLGGQQCNGCEATQNRACMPPAVPA